MICVLCTGEVDDTDRTQKGCFWHQFDLVLSADVLFRCKIRTLTCVCILLPGFSPGLNTVAVIAPIAAIAGILIIVLIVLLVVAYW